MHIKSLLNSSSLPYFLLPILLALQT
uniref:Uncharacterized protein n=1 Tax=Anguilla anguilla TaxID=7936 RepID=A0A0E9TNV2_ANGAN